MLAKIAVAILAQVELARSGGDCPGTDALRKGTQLFHSTSLTSSSHWHSPSAGSPAKQSCVDRSATFVSAASPPVLCVRVASAPGLALVASQRAMMRSPGCGGQYSKGIRSALRSSWGGAIFGGAFNWEMTPGPNSIHPQTIFASN